MKRLLKSPLLNAVCISLFTAFYTAVFYGTAGNTDFQNSLYYKEGTSFWAAWSDFLAAGRQIYIAWVLIGATVLVAVLLVRRCRPYDEYHISILIHCLVAALALTLAAIAVFYVMILNEPAGILEKFTLFIVIHWITIVLADLVYVLSCRWR